MYKTSQEPPQICDIQENYSTGWVKIYRSLTKKGYYKNSKYVHLWIHLLLNANHKNREFMWNEKIIIVKEGQLLAGRHQLSLDTGISESSIERILNLLENEHQIEQQKTTRYRLITIVNWTSYQENGQQNGQQTDNRRTTDGQQTDTNKNDKNVKNDKKETTMVGERELVISEYFLDMLPVTLTSREIEAWAEWVDYRKEIRKKLTKRSANLQIQFLLNQPDLVGCIKQSIQNQWQGLFEVKNGINKPGNSKGADGEFLRELVENRAKRQRGD